jgi:hypothetical protein
LHVDWQAFRLSRPILVLTLLLSFLEGFFSGKEEFFGFKNEGFIQKNIYFD